MDSDTLHIECPECKSFVPVTTYKGLNENIDFCVEEAPLEVLAEVNESSRNEEIQCMTCGMHIALVVQFLAYTTPLSEKSRFCKKWRKI